MISLKKKNPPIWKTLENKNNLFKQKQKRLRISTINQKGFRSFMCSLFSLLTTKKKKKKNREWEKLLLLLFCVWLINYTKFVINKIKQRKEQVTVGIEWLGKVGVRRAET